MDATLATRRLHNQFITRSGLRHATDVVAWLGAVQAQEFDAAKWALGLRMRGRPVDADIQRAFDEGRILRTHVMRPTWHFVTPSDIRWLLELTAPHVHRSLASFNRQLELDPRVLTRGTGVIERALRDGQHLTRTELGARLQRAGLTMAGQRLAQLVMYAELEAVICSGPRRGKQMTYALLAERAPDATGLPRDEALATLATRFIRSHGPATLRDFVWWSGLPTADARRALETIEAQCTEAGALKYWSLRGTSGRGVDSEVTYLLPIYDEYLVAYRDRQWVAHGPSTIPSTSRGAVVFQHAVVRAGQVIGTWRASRTPRAVMVHAVPLRRLSAANRDSLTAAVNRYQRFVGLPVELVVD